MTDLYTFYHPTGSSLPYLNPPLLDADPGIVGGVASAGARAMVVWGKAHVGSRGNAPGQEIRGRCPPEAADDILAIEWQIIQWKWDIIVQFLVYQHTPDVSQFQWHIGTKFQRLPPYFRVQKVNGSIGDTSRWNRKWEFQDGGRWTASTYSSGYRQGSNDIPRILHIFVVRQLNGT